MSALTETLHAGGFIVSEPNGSFGRDSGIILSGEGKLPTGAVLGQAAGAVTQAFAGTGNGVLTMDATTPVVAGAQIGKYKVLFIEPTTNLGTFEVEDPNGVVIGSGVVGTAFNNQIKFAIADGSTDFSAGDTFTLTVAAGKWRSADPTNTDGSSVAKAILFAAIDATSADATGVLFVEGEVRDADLTYDANVDDNTKKITKIAELAAARIKVR